MLLEYNTIIGKEDIFKPTIMNESLHEISNEIAAFFLFPNVFAICRDTFRYIQQMVYWEARAGRGVLCSTPP
jgi:hypothetical protein